VDFIRTEFTRKYLYSIDGRYDVTRAARAVSDFTIDQLSNWYVRRNRRRFWKSEKGRDKTAAYQTLHECLLTITKTHCTVCSIFIG
jgi:isoleucyl-tRNA synthetase